CCPSTRNFNDFQRVDQQIAIRRANALQSVPPNLCEWDVDVAYTISGLQAIAVEDAGDKVVISDKHELTHGGDHIGGCAVPLTAAALGQAHLAVHTAHPVDHENDLGGCVVDIGHHFMDDGRTMRSFSLQPRIGRRCGPDGLEVRRQ
ncbi:hypothetical protein, partial [Bradyrhizobium campsiandrae]|uniref:hypothetical protein n=1 Tax=Bradyrhizobium campsiandrae TaxID=1729892 RepID=UPI001FCF2610